MRWPCGLGVVSELLPAQANSRSQSLGAPERQVDPPARRRGARPATAPRRWEARRCRTLHTRGLARRPGSSRSGVYGPDLGNLRRNLLTMGRDGARRYPHPPYLDPVGLKVAANLAPGSIYIDPRGDENLRGAASRFCLDARARSRARRRYSRRRASKSASLSRSRSASSQPRDVCVRYQRG